MRAELRRSIFLACAGLLAGFALVVTLYGAGTLFKQGLAPRTGTPDEPAALLLAPTESPRPGEEGAPPPGKPRAALQGRQIPEPNQGSTPAGTGTAQGQAETSQAETSQAETSQAETSQAETSQAPTFDIIRIEPSGEAVIAGRAAPNTTVELLRDNAPMARALVDPSGQFALVPPALPIGGSEITLRVTGADGRVRVSRDSVSVVVSPHRTAKPLIALTSPDKPTIVLSQPDPAAAPAGTAKAALAKPELVKPDAKQAETAKPETAKPETAKPETGRLATNMPGAAGTPPAEGSSIRAPTGSAAKPAVSGTPAPVKIVSVEAEEGGRLYVTSQARPGATVRLYLNDTLVAPGSVGADGRVAFTIGRGVRPGDYKIRVDQVDPVTGAVKTRSEVAFAVPAAVAKPGSPAPEGAIPADPGSAPSRPAPLARSGAPENPPVQTTAPPKALAAMPPAPAAGVSSPAGTGPAASVSATSAGSRPTAESAPAGTPTVFVPEIGTATIIRGDSLWQISRRIYGKGTRYTVIYDANQPQIRNPDLIYPGQIFVLPGDGSAAVPQPGSRG